MRNILLVDPDMLSRNIIENDIRLQDYKLFLASHGGEALEILEDYSIDCVVIDLDVEHVNGLEIIDLLQRNIRRPWIIATCRHKDLRSDYPWLELATTIGADEILTKPYCLDQLLDRFPSGIVNARQPVVEVMVHNVRPKCCAQRSGFAHQLSA